MIPFAPDLTFLAPERFALLLVPLLLARCTSSGSADARPTWSDSPIRT